VVRDRPEEAAGAEASGPRPSLREVLVGTGAVLANPHTWPPFLAFFGLYSATSNLMLWVVPYMRDVYGLPTTRAALYATAISLALLVSGPTTGYVSDRVVRRRKLPYTLLTACQVVLYGVLVATLGALPLWGVYALLFALGIAGGAFVLTWPIGREVNPPHLAGVAVAVVNMGGFLGAALTQGPIGAVLDARWTGAMVAGARVYPPGAYRAAFAVCGLFVVGSVLMTLLFRETGGRNIHDALRR
jgi:MFS family permease